MQISVQPTLPSCRPTAVAAAVSIVVTSSGLWTVGHELRELDFDQVVALGVEAPTTAHEAARQANDLVAQLNRILPSLVDAPPFD